MRALLEIDGVFKAFFGVKALSGVSFSVPAGGAIGLVGENGAGKSTLMNILGGTLRPDAGAMRFDGAEYAPRNPQEAAARGIAFIHQELNLFPNLTVAENLFLTRFPKSGPFILRREINQRAAKLLAQVGLDVAPDTMVETLSAGQRQLVEIAKALSIDAKLIIFDEPTTSLSAREAERLFELIARLRAQGIAMIYISHALADVSRLCAEIVVLRDGEVVGRGVAGEFSIERLVSLMVGRAITQMFPTRSGKPMGDPLLNLKGLTRWGAVEDVSLELRAGEILGLAGLMGAGRSELARLIFGLDARDRGEVVFHGEALEKLGPRDLIQRGIGFVTENRHSEGLCLEGTVSENLMLATIERHTWGPGRLIMESSIAKALGQISRAVGLKVTVHDDQPARTLSGGNQQKVVLGKWLLAKPRLLILDEPTRGIDVGAKAELYRIICDLADTGAGILVISSEIEELLGLCDRILVMRGGRLVGEKARAQFDREEILRLALGGAK